MTICKTLGTWNRLKGITMMRELSITYLWKQCIHLWPILNWCLWYSWWRSICVPYSGLPSRWDWKVGRPGPGWGCDFGLGRGAVQAEEPPAIANNTLKISRITWPCIAKSAGHPLLQPHRQRSRSAWWALRPSMIGLATGWPDWISPGTLSLTRGRGEKVGQEGGQGQVCWVPGQAGWGGGDTGLGHGAGQLQQQGVFKQFDSVHKNK